MKILIMAILLTASGLVAAPNVSFAHDDWSNRSQAAAAAHDLSYSAYDFAQQVLYATGYSHLSGDSRNFAQDAEHFHESIESGAPYEHLLSDYYHLENSYNHLSQAFYYAHQAQNDPNVHEHWHQIEHAWQDLSWTFRGGHGERS